MMAADPLPVLLVISDQQDFYYQEYGDTRLSLEEAGVQVRVAATTTDRTIPHANTGEPAGTDGGIVPDIALSQVNSADYSAIVFVGGWGSSMYQYAFSGDYQNDRYDGDLATKEIVNNLINDFVEEDKQVAAVCHGVTVLAWARVDGASPLSGKNVSVPFIGSPSVFYQNTWYGHYQLGQHEQIVANGGIANTTSGQYGDPTTVADDVVVDGRIITAENYDAAREFGRVIAREVIASAGHEDPPVEIPPPVAPNTVVRQGNDVIAQGTAGDDTVYIWSGARAEDVYVWMNGSSHGPFAMAGGGVVKVFAGDGNDRIYATDSRYPVTILGEEGHDVITGGSADDVLDGGQGVDRVWGSAGNDLLLGGGGNDFLYGREGNDVLVGGEGDDTLDGDVGHDLLFGGLGSDHLAGGAGEDLLIGGTTSYDTDRAALDTLRRTWLSPATVAERAADFTAGTTGGVRLAWGATVHDDESDVLLGGPGDDLIFASIADSLWADPTDLVRRPS